MMLALAAFWPSKANGGKCNDFSATVGERGSSTMRADRWLTATAFWPSKANEGKHNDFSTAFVGWAQLWEQAFGDTAHAN
jgi:hypothetical protein